MSILVEDPLVTNYNVLLNNRSFSEPREPVLIKGISVQNSATGPVNSAQFTSKSTPTRKTTCYAARKGNGIFSWIFCNI